MYAFFKQEVPEWLNTYLKADEAFKTKDFQLAITLLSKCIEMDDSNPAVFIQRANALFVEKEYDKAMADVHRALSLDQRSSSAYSTKALIEWTAGNIQDALVSYNKAIDLGDHNAEEMSFVYMNRGQIKRDIGKLEDALADFKKAIELDETNTLAQSLLELSRITKESPGLYKRYMEKFSEK